MDIHNRSRLILGDIRIIYIHKVKYYHDITNQSINENESAERTDIGKEFHIKHVRGTKENRNEKRVD